MCSFGKTDDTFKRILGFFNFYFVSVNFYLLVCMYKNACNAHRTQKRVLDPLELQRVVSSHIGAGY